MLYMYKKTFTKLLTEGSNLLFIIHSFIVVKVLLKEVVVIFRTDSPWIVRVQSCEVT